MVNIFSLIILPFTIFIFWSAAIVQWTGNFSYFTTYSYFLDKAGSLPRNFPQFNLVDQRENRVDYESWKGKYKLVDFMYMHCSEVCGIVRSRLSEYHYNLDPILQEKLDFVSISFDVHRDTPENLDSLWRSMGSSKSWKFYTFNGNESEVFAQLLDFGVYIIREPSGDFRHTVMHFLLDSENRVVAIIDPSIGKEKVLLEIKKEVF